MKKTLLFILLFSAYFCHAQNYQCLQSGVKHYFANANGYLRGIRIDSVSTFPDSVIYYPYHTLRGYYPTHLHLDTTGGSWLGKKVIQLNDGTFIFDNLWHDSVIIKTQANIGDSWVFYNDTTTLYYQANLISVDTMTIFGSVDSIKKILITAHDPDGIVTTDPVNSFEVMLSKNNGFVQVFDLFTFPYHKPDSAYMPGIDYYLDFITGPLPYYPPTAPTAANAVFSLVKFINPTYLQLYDWNIGDVFENSTFAYGIPSEGLYPFRYYFDSIINKTTVSGGVRYDYMGWVATQMHDPFATVLPWINYTYLQTGNSGSLVVSDKVLIDTNILPEEKGQQFLIFYKPGDTSFCMQSCTYQFCQYELYGNYYHDFFESTPIIKTYKTGIGLVKYNWNILAGSPPYVEDTTLLYYNKSGYPCGNYTVPHPLVDHTSIAEITPIPVELYPNPATSELTITSTDKIINITISNLLGQTVYSESTTPRPILKTPHIAGQAGGEMLLNVDVSNLAAGVYFIKINGTEVRKFVKQ